MTMPYRADGLSAGADVILYTVASEGSAAHDAQKRRGIRERGARYPDRTRGKRSKIQLRPVDWRFCLPAVAGLLLPF